MTKEEIIEEIKNNLIVIKGKNEHIEAMELLTVTSLIDKILNDFESRSCENCVHYKSRENYNKKVCAIIDETYTEHYCGYFMPPADFNCKHFKGKDDERVNDERD